MPGDNPASTPKRSKPTAQHPIYKALVNNGMRITTPSVHSRKAFSAHETEFQLAAVGFVFE